MSHIDRFDVVIAFVVLLVSWLIFRLRPALNIDAIHSLVEMANTKGGVIIILCFMSIGFFFAGMRLCYWGVNMMLDGKLSGDNALIVSAFNWVTGAAFGGAFGALLKTMTGESMPMTSPPPSNTVLVTSSAPTTAPTVTVAPPAQ